MLKGKNIILGICGSIAAYKSASLIRLLVKEEANVQVIMTPHAKDFITALTLSTLSGRPVLSQYFDSDSGEWSEHVKLALWADYILIAPATANTLAKFAMGLCDNLLTAVYLSARCPIYLAPAMDLDMWAHPSTQSNIVRLNSFGNVIIPPGHGELASGLVGEGRMAEPEEILSFLQGIANEDSLFAKKLLKGKTALVTAGPTYEAIDPVRFIGNHSSGKMGYALAECLHNLGAEVTLISGPSSLKAPHTLSFIPVISADEMLQACVTEFPKSDITIMSAAVADYRPKTTATEKIKKQETELLIELEKTSDILSTLGSMKSEHQLLVGFALETNNEISNAKAKLNKKNLDFIVLNSLKDEGAGFSGDNNKITILDNNGEQLTYELKSKAAVALDICKEVIKRLK